MSYSQCVFKCLIIVVVCCLIKNVHGLLEEVFRWKQMTYDMYHSGGNHYNIILSIMSWKTKCDLVLFL